MKLIPLAFLIIAGSTVPAYSLSSSSFCYSCTRTKKGRIKRSKTAIRDFKKTNPCPATGKTSGPCKGYVIDHVKPLKEGGADAPTNMQWQTEADAKAKDAVE
jgi:hypothetical protein